LAPLGPLGGARGRAPINFWGLGGARGGDWGRAPGPGGALFGPRAAQKVLKNSWLYVVLSHRGVPGGRLGRTPKTARWIRSVDRNRGAQNGASEGPGPPPGPPRGAQKARVPLAKSVLEAAILKMYGFPKETQCLLEIAKSLPGGVRSAFFPKFRGPGRAQAPPEGVFTFSGGVPGSQMGPGAKARGGPGGAKGAHFLLQGAVS